MMRANGITIRSEFPVMLKHNLRQEWRFSLQATTHGDKLPNPARNRSPLPPGMYNGEEITEYGLEDIAKMIDHSILRPKMTVDDWEACQRTF